MIKLLKVASSLLLVGAFVPSLVTTAVASPVTTITEVAGGSSSSYLVRSDGTLWGWGDNSSGELGTTASSSQSRPIQIAGLTNVAKVAGGYGDTLALKNDGSVWGLGYNINGQLGDNSTQSTSVAEQVYGLANIQSVAAGAVFSLALKNDGTVWAWGNDQQGQLGVASATLPTYYSSVPLQVSGMPTIQQIAAGNSFSLALDTSGNVWAWGDNDNGELGNTTPNSSSTATQIAGLSNVKQVAAGYDTSYALKTDGTVWAWGSNTFGELGSSTPSSSSSPVQISGLSNVTAISSNEGSDHVVALKSDGTVWSWGLNSSGELGNGSTANQSATPVQASNLLNVVSAAGGDDFTVAVKNDGTVWAWGNNTDGQVGTAYSKVPIVVPAPFDAHLQQSVGLNIPGLNFDQDTTSYTVLAPQGAFAVSVTPKADDPNATITINGAPISNGQASTISLHVGTNPISITVTSADQSATMTYAVNITVPHPPISFAQSTYSVATGSQVAVSGVVYDVYDNPVVNSGVTLTANGGSWTDSGTPSSPVTTDVYGIFTDNWQAPSTPGQFTLTAQGNNSSNTVTVSVYSAPSGTVSNGGGSTTGNTSSSSTGSSTGNPTGNSTGGSAGGSGATTSPGTPSGSSLPPGGSFNLPGILMYGTVDSQGDSQSFPDGDSTVSIDIPPGAFPSPEYLSVATGSIMDFSSAIGGLSDSNVPIVLGVNFDGPAPLVPITLTIKNLNISPSTLVYKLMSDGSLKAVPATVTDGQIQISFSADPNFILLNVKPNQRVITTPHQAKVVPAIVKGGDACVPVWYVMQLMKSFGVKSHWDGHNLRITTAHKVPTSFLKASRGSTKVYVNGALVQSISAFDEKDPYSGKTTTYMPVWSMTIMLNRLGIRNTWNDTTWAWSSNHLN